MSEDGDGQDWGAGKVTVWQGEDGPSSIIVALDNGRRALTEARDDFERLRVRDAAKAYAAAAEVLKRRDVQVVASELVQDAERAIVKANPPNPPGRGKTVSLKHGFIEPSVVRHMRSAHVGALADEGAYERVKADHRERQEPITRAALQAVAKGRPHVSQGTGEPEWYTPPEIVAHATAVLGAIDIDPASSPKANETVKAARFFTTEDNALTMPEWAPDGASARLWMNPPYDARLVAGFTDRLLAEIDRGAVGAALVLVNNATETRWGSGLLAAARRWCFPTGRIRFVGETRGTPLQGQMILGLGPDLDLARFEAEFGAVGVVGEPCRS